MNKQAKKSARRARQTSAKVHLDATAKNMSSKAGLIPVIKFLDKLGFRELFQQTVHHGRGHNAVYTLEDSVFLIVVGLIGGAYSLSKCVFLCASCRVLQRVSGWLRIPDETTLGRVFKEVGERQVSELETLVHRMRTEVWQRVTRAGTSQIGVLPTLWIDVDSSVKTVYGKQQGTAKGYNPHKKGARSYHPLLAFCTETKEILQGWLRTGSAYTSHGIVEFMKQLLAQLPDSQRIIFRGDSGFFVGALLDYLDGLGHGYLIKVKLKNLKTVLNKQHWTAIPGKPGWQQCQFWYQANNWNASRLLVAVRQQSAVAPTAQLSFFEPVQYDMFCYVASDACTPWQAHTTYGQRATSETWIEEAKTQMGLAHLKTADFLANAALFQCAIIAYNTLRWMALTTGNTQLKQWEPDSLRIHLICVAGKLLTGGNQLRVKLPANQLHPKPWDDWLSLAA